MELDELLQKLKPILGERVDALWIEYQLNPEGRREMEGMIRALANRYLNTGYEQKEVLLVPPPDSLATGDYKLGKVYYGSLERTEFGLREDEWIQHVAIFGRTGSGKTNVGFLIIKNFLQKTKPFLIFDWKRNYRDILTWSEASNVKVFTVGRDIAPFRFNPLIPPRGTRPTIWLKKLIEIMCHVYWLGEGVAYLLQKAIDKVYEQYNLYDREEIKMYPTMADVRDWIAAYKARGREAQWMESTVRVLGTLCYGEVGKVLNIRKPSSIDDLLRKNVILELDALTNSDKTFLIESLLLWIHHYRLQDKARETFKHAIIIEEAHHVLLKKKDTKESIMDIIVREIRELGESLIVIDQHPSLISIPSLGNSYCTIAMNLKHARDVNAISDAMLVATQDKEFLGTLEPGTGIAKLQGRWHRPFVVRFPLVQVVKGSVTDEDLRRRMQGYFAVFEDIPSGQAQRKEVRPIRARDNIVEDQYQISEDEKRMLVDVMENPTSGVADRYKRLGFSVHRGSKLISSLISHSFLFSSFVPTFSGRVRYLWLSEEGKELLQRYGFRVDRKIGGGPEHEYWKHKVAEHFRKQGYEVEIEKEAGQGHAIDLIASKDGKSMAVEIETGKSQGIANVKKDLEVDFDRILVIGLTPEVRKQLANALREEIQSGLVKLKTQKDFAD